LGGGVPAAPGLATGERKGSTTATTSGGSDGGGRTGRRGGGPKREDCTGERFVDSEAAGWPGIEPRDWIPEMRQTDGTPEPSSAIHPSPPLPLSPLNPSKGQRERGGDGSTLCSPR